LHFKNFKIIFSLIMNEKVDILLEFEPVDRYGEKYYTYINVEAELTALLSEEIAVEIDREIINELFRINGR